MKYIIDVPEGCVDSSCELIAFYKNTSDFIYKFNTGITALRYDESAAEQRGTEKAWELCKKILSMPLDDFIECFGDSENTSYAEARDKYEAWMKQKDEEIKVGDEVVNTDYEKMTVCVIDEEGCLYGFGFNRGKIETWSGGSDPKLFHKTGRHFPEVADLLEKMREP